MSWSVLQSAGANSGTTSVSVTFSSNCTSGSKLIAYVACGTPASGSVSSVKDGSGNSFTSQGRVQLNNSTGLGWLYIWTLDTPSGDAGTKPTFTAITSSGGGNTVSLLVEEVSGVATGTSGILDGTWGTLQGNGGTSTGSPTYSSTAAGEYLVTVYGDNGGPATYTGPSGWTTDSHGVNSNGNDDIAVAYKSSTGSAESGGGWTLTSSGQQWAVAMVAFKLASGGHTATAALTVTPTFTAQRTHSATDSAALTVTPTFSAHASAGAAASLTVTPSFSASPSGGASTSTLFGQATETVTANGVGNAGTIGLHFTVSTAATLAGIWLYSPSGQSLTQLPTVIGLYTTQASPTSGTLVTSNTASWSGAAGSGWVFAAFSSPPALASGTNYMAAAFRNDAVNAWFCYTDPYTWPVSNSPITAPDDVNPGQGWYNKYEHHGADLPEFPAFR